MSTSAKVNLEEYDTGVRDDGWTRTLTNFIANHPCLMILCSMGFSLILISIYAGGLVSDSAISGDSPGQVFAVATVEVRRYFASLELAKRSDKADVVPVLSESAWIWTSIYDSKTDDVFTKQGLRDIWEIEKDLLDGVGFQSRLCKHIYGLDGEDLGCSDPVSLVLSVLMPELLALDFGADLLQVPAPAPAPSNGTENEGDVPGNGGGGSFDFTPRRGMYGRITEEMFDTLDDDEVKRRISLFSEEHLLFFGDVRFHENPDSLKSKYSRSLIYLGSPVNETDGDGNQMFINSEDDPVTQQDVHEADVEPYFEVVADIRKKDLSVDFIYFEPILSALDISNLVTSDFFLAGFAGFAVFLLMWIQTTSFFLAWTGMLNILFSYPIALFLYHAVFRYEINTQTNLLGVYIILGIGADDVFVYVDAWKQSWHEGKHLQNDIEARVNWTWRRAAGAMFITSFTTFFAFLMTAISPIPAVATFGVISALMILVNYGLVITFYPAVVVLWSKKFEKLTMICQEKEQFITKDSRRLEVSRSSRLNPDPHIEKYRMIERFFFSYVSPFLNRFKIPIALIGALFLILGAIGMAFLEPPDQQRQTLPEESELVRYLDIVQGEFKSSQTQSTSAVISMYWGVEPDDPVDRSVVDANDNVYLGALNWDPEFDFGITQQDEYLRICNRTDEAVASDGEMFVIPEATVCFMRVYREWETNRSYEQTDDMEVLAERFFEFTQTDDKNVLPVHHADGVKYSQFLDYIGGILDSPPSLTWVRASFEASSLQISQNNRNLRQQWSDEWKALMDDINSESVEGFNKGFQTSRLWAGAATSRTLVSATYQAIGISYLIATCALFLSSGNYIIASLSSLAIMGIVLSTIGAFVASGQTLGWEESISYTFLVGLSVDYVVHLANAYNEQQFVGRFYRSRGALLELGISIFAASVTTAISAFFLLFTKLGFFQTFGKFIFVTITLSLFWSVILFMAALMLFGPDNFKTGNFRAWFANRKQKNEGTEPMSKTNSSQYGAQEDIEMSSRHSPEPEPAPEPAAVGSDDETEVSHSSHKV